MSRRAGQGHKLQPLGAADLDGFGDDDWQGAVQPRGRRDRQLGRGRESCWSGSRRQREQREVSSDNTRKR